MTHPESEVVFRSFSDNMSQRAKSNKVGRVTKRTVGGSGPILFVFIEQ